LLYSGAISILALELKTKGENMADITKEQLEELYVNQGLSVRQCAKELGLSTHGSLGGMMKRFGIKARPQLQVDRFNGGATPRKINKTIIYCTQCGKQLERFPSQIGERNFCSFKCKGEYYAYDMAGKRIGILTVIKKLGPDKHGHPLWECLCDCGVIKNINTSDLGIVKSCGCLLHVRGENHHAWKGGMAKVRCSYCGKEKEVQLSQANSGSNFFCHETNCKGKWMAEHLIGEDHPRFLDGGCGYDVYSEQLSFAEDVRRARDNKDVLEVRCVNCNSWFKPTSPQVSARIRVLYGKKGARGSAYFYCSDGCKKSCSVFNKIRHPEGHNPRNSIRNETLDPDLNTLVLNRDSYQCQKCGACTDLEVHHIEGVAQSPMTANDIDNCLTVCHECHKAIHSQPGCTYHDYQREACEDKNEAQTISL
jgi:hypothetical protein